MSDTPTDVEMTCDDFTVENAGSTKSASEETTHWTSWPGLPKVVREAIVTHYINMISHQPASLNERCDDIESAYRVPFSRFEQINYEFGQDCVPLLDSALVHRIAEFQVHEDDLKRHVVRHGTEKDFDKTMLFKTKAAMTETRLVVSCLYMMKRLRRSGESLAEEYARLHEGVEHKRPGEVGSGKAGCSCCGRDLKRV